MTLDRPIYLIGYMGCGKSTLGRNVERIAGIPFVDLDKYIEVREGLSVREIFAQRGEAAFRQAEADALRECSTRPQLIACGGGTPCHHGNMELMNATGLTVRLEAGFDKLFTRLARGRHKRPLLAGLDDEQLAHTIRAGLAEREPWYSQARVTFRSDLLETEVEATETAQRFINDLIINYDL